MHLLLLLLLRAWRPEVLRLPLRRRPYLTRLLLLLLLTLLLLLVLCLVHNFSRPVLLPALRSSRLLLRCPLRCQPAAPKVRTPIPQAPHHHMLV
jgi:hypothetical protein